MKQFIVTILLFCAIHVSAQQSRVVEPFCKSSFDRILLEGKNNRETIEGFIKNSISTFADKRCGLKFNYRNESLGGYHYSFTQTFSGVPVYQSEIKVNTDKRNTITSVFDNSRASMDWQLKTETADEHSIIYVHPVTDEASLATLDVSVPENEVIRVENNVLYQRDTRMYFMDSTVSGKVFNPDPLTAAHKLYDTNTVYKHNNNANASWIEAQLQTVNFKAKFDGIYFSLDASQILMADFDTPQIAPVKSTLPQFYYSRPHPGLEDVMAFYHASVMHDYVKALGFDCSNKLVTMDAHAIYNEDQSFFSPNYSPQRIYFGTGGVPDAQDADVIIHEYSHFLSENASPNSNIGHERTSLDEGFGDYMAAAYSRSLDTFNQGWVFSWDGHNEFWKGREVITEKYYPQHLFEKSIYADGEIWSTTLFKLNRDLRRSLVDSLILEAHYNYAQRISMPNAAQLLIIADTLLENGANYCTIYKNLYERGLMPFRANPCGISSIGETSSDNGLKFLQDGSSFKIVADANFAEPVMLDLYSISGAKLISLRPDFSAQPSFAYENHSLPAGMYAIHVHHKNMTGAFKWVKTN